MKKYIFLVIFLLSENAIFAHCQIPCGIYDDALRIIQIKEDFKTIKKAQKKRLKISINYSGPIEAPTKKDQVVGKLKVVFDENLLGEYDLLTLNEVKKVNIFSRFIKRFNFFVWGDV